MTWLTVLLLVIAIDSRDNENDCQCIIENELKYIDQVLPLNDPLYSTVRFDQFGAYHGSLQERDETLSPTIIVIPRTEIEIQETINFAVKCGYSIMTRSGGHQYSALSSCNRMNGKCIQIDMKHFNYINFVREEEDGFSDKITSITVGVGTRLNSVYNETNKNNVVIVGGGCGTVGVGGHYQSSSQGVWTRSLGLGLDWIKRIKIITADGKIRNLYNKKQKDLFWAILGGSPGSMGVVIEYEFEPIYNEDYMHSSIYGYRHYYTPQSMEAFFRAIIILINNPYFYEYNDCSIYLAALYVDSKAFVVNVTWTGIDNGDINGRISGHPLQKTWYEEIIKPFADIDNLFAVTRIEKFEGSITISTQSAVTAPQFNKIVPVPPFRYYQTHSIYTRSQRNLLFNDSIKSEKWIQSVLNALDQVTNNNNNNTDNIGMLFQFWSFVGNQFSHNPLENDVSYPLRDIDFEVESWILFGNNDQYDINQQLKAKQIRDDLETIFSKNQIKTNIKSFGYTDLNANQYDLNTQFNDFYNYRVDVYEKLKEIKTRIDCYNIFKGPLTIPPNRLCQHYHIHSQQNVNILSLNNINTNVLLLISLLLNIFVIITISLLCWKIKQKNAKYSRVLSYTSSDE